jgi:hypothetical protein
LELVEKAVESQNIDSRLAEISELRQFDCLIDNLGDFLDRHIARRGNARNLRVRCFRADVCSGGSERASVLHVGAKRSLEERKCDNKRRFATQEIALEGNQRLRRELNESFDTLQPYRCRFCGAYHFSNAPRLAKLLARKAAWDAANLRREAKQRKWKALSCFVSAPEARISPCCARSK